MGKSKQLFCMKIKSTSAASEEHVRFHTTTSSHVVYPSHHMHWESDKSFMRQTLCMQNINCPHMAGLKQKERKNKQELTLVPFLRPHLKEEFHFSTGMNNDMHKFSVQQARMALPFIWSETQLTHLSPGSPCKLSFGCPKPMLGV